MIFEKSVITILANPDKKAVVIAFTKHPGRGIHGSIFRMMVERRRRIRLSKS